MSGEDHNQAVAHAAIGLVSKPDKEKKRGGRSGGGEKSGAGCAPRKEKGEEREKGERGEQGGKKGCISPLPACASAMPPCHAVA